MKIELNGKALLSVALLSAGIAFGDFVTMIDTKTNKVMMNQTNGISDDEKEDLMLEIMPIGSIVLRLDLTNPSDIYGGTWSQITGDASLALGNGSDLTSATISGENEKIVKLPKHSHSINHNHPKVSTTTDGNHRHGIKSESTVSNKDGALGDSWDDNHSSAVSNVVFTEYAGNHNHDVDLPNFTGNSGVEGVETEPMMDVRGARFAVNVWKRTN